MNYLELLGFFLIVLLIVGVIYWFIYITVNVWSNNKDLENLNYKYGKLDMDVFILRQNLKNQQKKKGK